MGIANDIRRTLPAFLFLNSAIFCSAIAGYLINVRERVGRKSLMILQYDNHTFPFLNLPLRSQ
jgi:hypothetical protein